MSMLKTGFFDLGLNLKVLFSCQSFWMEASSSAMFNWGFFGDSFIGN